MREVDITLDKEEWMALAGICRVWSRFSLKEAESEVAVLLRDAYVKTEEAICRMHGASMENVFDILSEDVEINIPPDKFESRIKIRYND